MRILKLIINLGILNVFRVFWYRTKIKFGWRPCATLDQPEYPKIFFDLDDCIILPAVTIKIFGWFQYEILSIPKWDQNPFNINKRVDLNIDWARSLDALNGEDPKHYWELSRFYWAPEFAFIGISGNKQYLYRLELWLRDWIKSNPPYKGINWACAQEASIRLTNLALTALILNSMDMPTPMLQWLIKIHSDRIYGTLGYSIGQDNNHGSIESSALFIAGTWCRFFDISQSDNLIKIGRKWLNNRAVRLIQSDGSPSQYSINYHRANLETFTFAGVWAKRLGVNCFSSAATQRILCGVSWLYKVVDMETGDAPNIGANDGSHLYNFCLSPYRDFRPTVQLASAVFATDLNLYPNYHDVRLDILELKNSHSTKTSIKSCSPDFASDGTDFVANVAGALVVMRTPKFLFRPSQADALHLDFWLLGNNILRDSGTFSYVGDMAKVYASTAFHNTVQFDCRDQMPKFGKFLYSNWLKPNVLFSCSKQAKATFGYKDYLGATHRRSIVLAGDTLDVEDALDKFRSSATLRWRLMPIDWKFDHISEFESKITSNIPGLINIWIVIKSTVPMVRVELVDGLESKYYNHSSSVPVLEVEISMHGVLNTHVGWSKLN